MAADDRSFKLYLKLFVSKMMLLNLESICYIEKIHSVIGFARGHRRLRGCQRRGSPLNGNVSFNWQAYNLFSIHSRCQTCYLKYSSAQTLIRGWGSVFNFSFIKKRRKSENVFVFLALVCSIGPSACEIIIQAFY
jgi:hypothetical protein